MQEEDNPCHYYSKIDEATLENPQGNWSNCRWQGIRGGVKGASQDRLRSDLLEPGTPVDPKNLIMGRSRIRFKHGNYTITIFIIQGKHIKFKCFKSTKIPWPQQRLLFELAFTEHKSKILTLKLYFHGEWKVVKGGWVG